MRLATSYVLYTEHYYYYYRAYTIPSISSGLYSAAKLLGRTGYIPTYHLNESKILKAWWASANGAAEDFDSLTLTALLAMLTATSLSSQ